MTDNRIGLVPVDSGLVLSVDPALLPIDLLRSLCMPSPNGVAAAVIAEPPGGDGWHQVHPDWRVLDWADVRPIVNDWSEGR